jgi:two-component system, NarL family, response regulator NreC
MLRILVGDDHEVVRRGVISLIQSQPDFQIVGETSNGFEAVAMAEQLQPDVIVLDISLPGLNGLDAARQIRPLAASLQILFFSQHSAPEMVKEAMRIGGAGYVCKADAGRELVNAVHAVAGHERFLSTSCAS